MAPKKKKQPKQKANSSNKLPQPSSSSSSTPKIQISSENEARLRRLLLNSGLSSAPAAPVPVDATLSKAQKAKNLRSIYEKLSCEGFSVDQTELVLSVLKEGATFEAALDWLCLNVPGNELPLKFSTGTSLHWNEGDRVAVVSKARDDWNPSAQPSAMTIVETSKNLVQINHRRDDDTLDLHQPSQADWIRQYVEQQEENDFETWEDNVADENSSMVVPRPRTSYESIAKEYHMARMEALNAKEKGDKKSQEQAGHKIRQLKQEISILGLSDDILQFGHEQISASSSVDDVSCNTVLCKDLVESTSHDVQDCSAPQVPILDALESKIDEKSMEFCPNEFIVDPQPFGVSVQEAGVLDDDSVDVDIGDFFVEDDPSVEALPTEILNLQRKEKLKELASGKNLEKLDGIWKKGDPLKIPKAVLHQLSQRSGWEAPRFNKVPGKEKPFCYAVNVLRKASGRGKSKKAGGLVTLQLPDREEISMSVEDAQNRVSAYALCQLFPDLPVQLIITEPYSSLVMNWKEGESSTDIENMESRRVGFVESLLNSGSSESIAYNDDVNSSIQEQFQKPDVPKTIKDPSEDSRPLKANYSKELESSYLKEKQENKKKMQKYKDMLKTRTALPIAELRGEILKLLETNDVLVVCGETGCGKTTQVPQFILDNMIEEKRGGHCSIICTQPRRIAAISVAERVAHERCELSPGSEGSLVGYQVRLDSARNVKTKLLFCTTGILLRKIAGDNYLHDITHIIVDEVHERSLLGDFLLIVLKDLIEKQSAYRRQKLKLILMSATVDSKLFSSYFGDCPVVNAEGRTHPVELHFLEDVYESINYCLASDSIASMPMAYEFSKKGKYEKGAMDNHGAMKKLVLSGWGDESLLSEDIVNPFYVPTNYLSYSEQTQLNLKKLNEEVIDYDLLEDLVCYVDEAYPEGAILIFLPGVSEIYTLLDKLSASYQFGGPSSDWLLPLHSSIASDDQKKVFLQPPDNIRKVIIATNVAETSITIDDVVYVIDCGRHKENRYNSKKKLSSMVEDWISRANAKQRHGRAGRVKPGICFCLYTRHRFENLMRPFQVPEMQRMPLTELCLQIKLLSLGDISSFLLKALEPPKEEAMTSAISTLYEVGAIEGEEVLTPLGYHLARLPVDVLIGKMMLFGGIFGCLSPILSISAFLSYKSPFMFPKDERQNVERAKLALIDDKLGEANVSNIGDQESDHLVMIAAYNKWEKILRENGARAAQGFCNSHYLSSSVMYMIRDMRIQFGTLLADIGIINLPKYTKLEGKKKEILDSWFSDKSQPFNVYSQHSLIVKVILCAGLYPNLAATEQGITRAALGSLKRSAAPAKIDRPIWYDGRREVHIHTSSINSQAKAFQYPFLVFLEKIETNKVFLRDTTVVSPYAILLFGGSINIQHQTGLVTIDGWLKLAAPAQTAVLFKELRLTFHSVLQDLIRKPQVGMVNNEVVRTIIHLLFEEAKVVK